MTNVNPSGLSTEPATEKELINDLFPTLAIANNTPKSMPTYTGRLFNKTANMEWFARLQLLRKDPVEPLAKVSTFQFGPDSAPKRRRLDSLESYLPVSASGAKLPGGVVHRGAELASGPPVASPAPALAASSAPTTRRKISVAEYLAMKSQVRKSGDN